jgi:hypothetical protein
MMVVKPNDRVFISFSRRLLVSLPTYMSPLLFSFRCFLYLSALIIDGLLTTFYAVFVRSLHNVPGLHVGVSLLHPLKTTMDIPSVTLY